VNKGFQNTKSQFLPYGYWCRL